MKLGISDHQGVFQKPISKGSRGYLRSSGSLKRFQHASESPINQFQYG